MQPLGSTKIRCHVMVLAFITMGSFGSVMAQAASPGAVEDTGTVRFENFIRDYAEQRHFNGSIRVEEDGKALFQGSFGIADRAFDVPCIDSTKYKIASITKVFTAVLVLKTYRNVNRPGGIMGANGSFYHFNGVGFDKEINIVALAIRT